MQTNRRDLLLAGCCAASTALSLERFQSAQGRRPQSAARTTTIASRRIRPSASPAVRGQRLAECRGIHNVVYVQSDAGVEQAKASRWRSRLHLHFSGPFLLQVDRGLRVTLLAGIHVGCFELFAKEGIRSVADLKGPELSAFRRLRQASTFLSAMGARWTQTNSTGLTDAPGHPLRYPWRDESNDASPSR